MTCSEKPAKAGIIIMRMVFDQSFVRFACYGEPSGSRNWLFKDPCGYKGQKQLNVFEPKQKGWLELVVMGVGPLYAMVPSGQPSPAGFI